MLTSYDDDGGSIASYYWGLLVCETEFVCFFVGGITTIIFLPPIIIFLSSTDAFVEQSHAICLPKTGIFILRLPAQLKIFDVRLITRSEKIESVNHRDFVNIEFQFVLSEIFPQHGSEQSETKHHQLSYETIFRCYVIATCIQIMQCINVCWHTSSRYALDDVFRV
jgi:hypothetical protein